MKQYHLYGKQSEEMDEYDQPTEPMAKIVLSPSPRAVQRGPLTEREAPTPQPQEQQFPRPDSRATHKPQISEQEELDSPTYPYLPATPINRNGGRPASGVPSLYPQLIPSVHPAQPYQPHQSLLPVFVGLFFVIVQVLLLVRFVLKLLAWTPDIVWVSLIYDMSSLFVYPFQLLLQNIAVAFPPTIEIATLLAILMYGFFSRILVRFLKAVLHSR